MKQHALADASLIRKISLTIFFFALLSINKKKKKKSSLSCCISVVAASFFFGCVSAGGTHPGHANYHHLGVQQGS